MQLKLLRARATALIESGADAAAVSSVTPDSEISGADTEQRAARLCRSCFLMSESSSLDRERSPVLEVPKPPPSHAIAGVHVEPSQRGERSIDGAHHRHMQVYSSSSSVP
jgi:hypothetical protein